jgi:hypothetical protein
MTEAVLRPDTRLESFSVLELSMIDFTVLTSGKMRAHDKLRNASVPLVYITGILDRILKDIKVCQDSGQTVYGVKLEIYFLGRDYQDIVYDLKFPMKITDLVK